MQLEQSQQYRKSNYLVTIESENGKSIAYHSLFNNPRIFERPVVNLINNFSSPKTLEEVSEFYGGDLEQVIQELVKLYFIVRNDEDERELIGKMHKPFIDEVQKGSQLSRLELAISDACNLGCSHCMHFNNNQIETRTSPTLNMSIEVAKRSIDAFTNKVKQAGNALVRVHFGNGEPLLNWATMKFCLEYCSNLDGLNCSFAVNTNLTILTNEIAETLKKYNVKISTSLDGLKEGNDLIRVDLKGEGTFDRIYEKIRLLREINHPIEGFTITVTAKNFDHINVEVVDFAKSIGVKDIAMDCDLVSTTGIPVEMFVAKILEMRSYANQQGMNFYGTWETPYRAIMAESWLNKPHSFCPAMEGRTLSFGVDGNLKTCGHTNTKVGHAANFVQIFRDKSPFLDLISNRLPGNNQMCRGCVIEGSCGGQCHVTVESAKRDNRLLETMCDFMRLSTRELLKEHLAEM